VDEREVDVDSGVPALDFTKIVFSSIFLSHYFYRLLRSQFKCQRYINFIYYLASDIMIDGIYKHGEIN
jgi:hypothetical protein